MLAPSTLGGASARPSAARERASSARRSRRAYAARGSSSVACSSSARNASDSSSWRRPPAARVEAELAEHRARLRRPRALAGAPELGEPVAQLLVARRRVEHAPHDELGSDGAVPAVLLEPERDVEAALPRAAGRAVRPCRTRSRCRRRGRAGGRGSADASRRRPSPARPPRSWRRAASRRGCRDRTAPAGRAPARGRASARDAGTTASITRHRREVLVARARRPRARRTPRRTPRAAPAGSRGRRRRGGRRSARGARSRRRARRGGRSAGSTGPSPSSASPPPPAIEHDGPVEALDEPRRDDADHALVPVLAPDDVAAPLRRSLRPGLDRPTSPRAGCGPRPPDARGSAPRAGRRARRASSASSVRISSSATSGRPSRPAALIRGASRKPTCARVDGGGIDAGGPHQRLQARPSACARAPAARRSRASGSRRASGTTSAIVASATRSRCASAPDARRRAAPARACRRRPCRRAPGTGTPTGASRRSGQSGSVSPGRWWSVTTTSSPSAFASATSSTAVMPQSTVSDETDAVLGEPRDRLAGDAVALLEAARQVPDDVGAEPRAASGLRAPSRRSRRRRSRRGRRSARRARSRRGCGSTAAAMSPSRNGSCGGCSPARKAPRVRGRVAAADEDAGGDLADPERLRERASLVDRARARSSSVRRASSVEGTDGVRTAPARARRRATRRAVAASQAARVATRRGVARPRNDSTDDLHPEQHEADRRADDDDGERREERHLLERVLRHPASRSSQIASTTSDHREDERRFTAPRVPFGVTGESTTCRARTTSSSSSATASASTRATSRSG